MNELRRGAGRTLHVDFVTETYPPEVSGAAATVHHLVEGLAGRGHEVHLVRLRQPAEEAGSEGVTTTLVPGLPLTLGEQRVSLPASRRLARLWSEATPDVVYVATEGLLGWSAVRAAEACGVPVVSGIHTRYRSLDVHTGTGLLQRPLYDYLRALHNRTRCTLVPTEQLRQELGADFHNVEVLERGIDTALFSPSRRSEALRRAWGAGPADPVVLYVGRLSARKNLPLALHTFHALRASNPRVKFVVVGSGPMYQEMFRPYEGILFVGTRTGEELAAHYASADIFLFPSVLETFGNVTLEAMASGLGVVAFDHSAARLLIRNGENGLLAPTGDEGAFMGAALRLLHDPQGLARMRQEARRTVASRDWKAVLDRFETILRRCSASRAPAPSTAIAPPEARR